LLVPARFALDVVRDCRESRNRRDSAPSVGYAARPVTWHARPTGVVRSAEGPVRRECPVENARANAGRMQRRLLTWLIEDACPLWSTHGFDRIHGGFHERLAGTKALDEPRRMRVQPRQVFALTAAAELGWTGNAGELASLGLDYLITRYRRPDGLFRTLVAANGRPIDDRVYLYDQAFALLGFAAGYRVLGAQSQLETTAVDLRARLYRHLKRPGAGFESGLSSSASLSANPHMHLLEAALAWQQISDDPQWTILCDEVGGLALEHLIDPSSGVLRENFMPDWSPMPGNAGRLVEPGHHFEWAWLLFQWGRSNQTRAWGAALRLIDTAEKYGVRNGVAINTMLDDGTVMDGSARLWVQAERLRTAAFAARATGEVRYWTIVNEAAAALYLYLKRGVPGSWYDRQTPEGLFIEEPAPASTFYHIVGALKELTAAVRPE
jgi:mannose/cellobiose epimerase-like protein (N-acyl-D-glucosamine 2-epimerase family)